MRENIMSLREQIDAKYKSSVKSKNTNEINTLRLIKSAIQNQEIENRSVNNPIEINDQQILGLMQNLIKQRRDSIESFKSANRTDLIELENKEIEIINQFLPKQLNEEEIKKIIVNFLKDNNLSSLKDMGKVMNYLKSNYTGSVEMSLAGKLAKELLNI